MTKAGACPPLLLFRSYDAPYCSELDIIQRQITPGKNIVFIHKICLAFSRSPMPERFIRCGIDDMYRVDHKLNHK